MTSRRGKPGAYSSSTSTRASRSGTSAAWTRMASRFPRTSTRSWRLRPRIFFSSIEPSLATDAGGLHRLAIDDGQSRLRVPAGLHAVLLDEIAVDPGEGPIPGPLIEIVADTMVIGELIGQQAPGAARPRHIAQGVDHVAQVQLGGSPGPIGPLHPWLDHRPLLVGQVRGIGTTRGRAAHTASSGRWSPDSDPRLAVTIRASD